MNLSCDPAMDALFAEWKKARPDYKLFSNDGILIREEWDKASPKIAFLLKESNDNFYEIRGNDFGPGPGSSSRVFWQNLNIWAYVVERFYNSSTPTLQDALERKGKKLRHVAYINLKKNAENLPKTDARNLQEYVEKDWNFIKRQLAMINPDVIFCCGTYRFIVKKMVLKHLGNGVYRRDDGTLIIDFYHPSWPSGGYGGKFERLTQMLSGLALAEPRVREPSLKL